MQRRDVRTGLNMSRAVGEEVRQLLHVCQRGVATGEVG